MLETNSEKSGCSFTIPLGTKPHSIARQKAHDVCNTDKDKGRQKRVYLNSLAVYAVDFYLKFLGFETDFEQSQSQNMLMLQFLTEADLMVKNIGKFECIPVEKDTEDCEITSDVFLDRSASEQEAIILGFTKTPSAKIDLNQLLSVDDLIDFLTDWEEEASVGVD
ncbi:MAG: DUF1822 family protein [Cyanobacteria bacterium J06635_10]